MEREEILVRFSILRQLAGSVPNYLAEKAGVDESPTLKTAVEEDWGMADLDTETLVLDFSQDYRVDISNFDFTGLISYAPTIKDTFLFFPLLFLLLFSWFFKGVAAMLLLPFNSAQAKRVWKSESLAFWLPLRKPDSATVLTVGDFVASAATGYFVKRERVKFTLVR